MKAKTICICKDTLIDKNTGLLSIINILNDIDATNIPVMIPQLCLVLITEKQEGDPKQIELELFLKFNKKLLAKNKIKIDYLDKKHNNFVTTIHGLVVDQAGILTFIVKKDNKQIAKHECSVNVKPKIKGKK